MKKLITLLTSLLLLNYLIANIINVPADYTTIQQAINESYNGDTILVAPGTYYENINFNGKNITVASNYILDNDLTAIQSTIINGSQPIHEDTASCVLFISGEDSTAVIAGFTITGGTGTRWADEHSPYDFTEGGGILIQYSSPTIRNNIIEYNEAIYHPIGITSAGGGGIRAGDSNPHILNNMILYNQGRYGGGIVLNYSGAVIKNNIIAYNDGGQDYGGGGIWCVDNGEDPIIIENNTIYGNSSYNGGGGMRIWLSEVTIRNCIFWANVASYSDQIQGNGDVTYSNIQDGYDGEGNIDSDPMFITNNNLLLDLTSPCVDFGNPDIVFNDPEDPNSTGEALFPAMGLLRNDMGAYGGPGSQEFPFVITDIGSSSNNDACNIILFPNPATYKISLGISDFDNSVVIKLYNIQGMLIHEDIYYNSMCDIDVSHLESGVYTYHITHNDEVMSGNFIKK